MSTRKLPKTSLEAYDKKKETADSDRKKIIQALQILGTANYEKIAKQARLEMHAVGRRLSELERMEKVFKPGTKTKTSRGCMAFEYKLMPGVEYVYEEGKETAAESAVKLIKMTKQKPTINQDSLF